MTSYRSLVVATHPA